jgi:predicted small lipoprotein YifL
MKFVLLLTFMATLSACGIKGKPLPPLPEEPLVATEEKSASVSQPTTAQPLKGLPTKKKSK